VPRLEGLAAGLAVIVMAYSGNEFLVFSVSELKLRLTLIEDASGNVFFVRKNSP
jgi:hypothetical protein